MLCERAAEALLQGAGIYQVIEVGRRLRGLPGDPQRKVQRLVRHDRCQKGEPGVVDGGFDGARNPQISLRFATQLSLLAICHENRERSQWRGCGSR